MFRAQSVSPALSVSQALQSASSGFQRLGYEACAASTFAHLDVSLASLLLPTLKQPFLFYLGFYISIQSNGFHYGISYIMCSCWSFSISLPVPYVHPPSPGASPSPMHPFCFRGNNSVLSFPLRSLLLLSRALPQSYDLPPPHHIHTHLSILDPPSETCVLFVFLGGSGFLRFYPLSCKCHDIILLQDCMEFHCAYVRHFLDESSADGQVGWVLFLALVTRMAVTRDAQAPLRCALESSGYAPLRCALESSGYAPVWNF